MQLAVYATEMGTCHADRISVLLCRVEMLRGLRHFGSDVAG